MVKYLVDLGQICIVWFCGINELNTNETKGVIYMDPHIDMDKFLDDMLQRAARVGMNRQELCRRAGIAETTLTRWRGKVSSPTLSKMSALEKAIENAQKTIDRAQAS